MKYGCVKNPAIMAAAIQRRKEKKEDSAEPKNNKALQPEELSGWSNQNKAILRKIPSEWW
jgi:hypothetical protein